MSQIWMALWFFLPAGIANVTPIFVAVLPGLRGLDTPLDFGKSWHGKRVFGEHKTIRGLVTGIAMGTLVFWLQRYGYSHSVWLHDISPLDYTTTGLWLGTLLGFGALSGDVLESFCKRQMGVAEGESWFPFDQIDYIVGGVLASLVVVRLPITDYLWILAIWFGIHLIASYIGYLLGLKAKPI